MINVLLLFKQILESIFAEFLTIFLLNLYSYTGLEYAWFHLKETNSEKREQGKHWKSISDTIS
ncbi:uncharacterized protein K441DRAFT_657843 [Cenococcum geophilum 1.58]|uniref:uncharacterized protein n=1 Tax=Cenococcum geophilum 1.58 TaxID=794803 RepID=UPI00358F018B|nr:hypothetical protein K441DRAFT_657843 [Cenococcum geophilum 1.58]